jgi:hypothetical protein
VCCMMRGPGALAVGMTRSRHQHSGNSTARMVCQVWWPCRRGACGWRIAALIEYVCSIDNVPVVTPSIHHGFMYVHYSSPFLPLVPLPFY